MAADTVDRLAKRLADAVPEGLRSVRDELEQTFRSGLDSGLARLDLVTREEFDVQQAVLARTRQKLDALERRVSSLEAGPGSASDATRGSAANGDGSSRQTE
jgi:BMFP domain-containing protein YqiC